MKPNYYKVIILTMCLFLQYASMAGAQLQALNDDELNAVTGQAGFVIQGKEAIFNTEIESLFYRDEDGVGPDGSAGEVGFYNIQFDCHVKSEKGFRVGATFDETSEGARVAGGTMALNGTSWSIDRLDIASIGFGPKLEDSLGSIHIIGMNTQITGGDVMISFH